VALNGRRLAREALGRSPTSVQRFARASLTRLHAAAAAGAAASHAVSRHAARAQAHDWGFFTLYLPGVEHPLYARPGTTDLYVFSNVFGRRQHAVDLGFEPKVILDLGANVGYTAVDFALRYPDARILAVEPEPSNLALRRTNVAAFPPVDVVEGAVWPHSGSLELDDPGTGHWGIRVRPGSGSVRALTVPELVERAGAPADLVKVDIEGAELDLFSEKTEWLADTRAVVVEFHDATRPGCKQAGESALARAGLPFFADVGGTRYYVRPRPQ
jgi:FkbM family methyltransferase